MSNSPSPTILIVDDDPDVSEALGEVLMEEGYQVRRADDGQAALDALATMSNPCLVLLDMMMPRMNGFQFLDALDHRRDLGDTPIVVVSAGVRPEQVTSRERVKDFISKPVDLHRLLEVLDKHCPRTGLGAPA